jgi:hypothetical protein
MPESDLRLLSVPDRTLASNYVCDHLKISDRILYRVLTLTRLSRNYDARAAILIMHPTNVALIAPLGLIKTLKPIRRNSGIDSDRYSQSRRLFNVQNTCSRN